MKVYFAVEKMLKNCDGSNMAYLNHSVMVTFSRDCKHGFSFALFEA